MDLDFSAEENAFRDEVRGFVRDKLPAAIRHKVLNGLRLTRDDYVSWQRKLFEQGWGGVSWPKEFGGPGWSPTERYIFEEECAAGGAPRLIPFGLRMLAPVLMAFGSQKQQQRYLPKIMAAEEWWCQGYSEPGAGTDLAALRTTAVQDGDDYVVNGQKMWTSLIQYADYVWLAVRTNPEAKKHRGISVLIVPTTAEGFSWTPVHTMAGVGTEYFGCQ